MSQTETDPEEVDRYDCSRRALAGATAMVDHRALGSTDDAGVLKLPLTSLMAPSWADAIPYLLSIDVGTGSGDASLAAVREAVSGRIVREARQLRPGHEEVALALGDPDDPLMEQVELECVANLRLDTRLDLQGMRAAVLHNAWFATGSVPTLEAGGAAEILCARGQRVAISLFADPVGRAVLKIDASAHVTGGRITGRDGKNLLLDKGRSDLVVAGRTGKLKYRGWDAGTFQVVSSTGSDAVARVVRDKGKARQADEYALDP